MEDLGGVGVGQGQHGAQGRLAERCGAHGAERLGTALCLSPGLMFFPCRGDRDVTHSKEAGTCHLSFVKGDNSEASGALASNS